MDYGKRAPDLGWRMTDAWLSMAGAGFDVGEPNGVPIDEWGIRMEAGSCNPGGRKRVSWWCGERSGCGLCDPQMG